MTEFWLNNFMELFDIDNFNMSGSKTDNYIKVLNVVALLTIVIGTVTIILTKQPFYFTIVVLVLSLTILIKSNISTTSMFTPTDSILNSRLSNSYDTGVYLIKAVNIDPNGLNNVIYVNTALNFKMSLTLNFVDCLARFKEILCGEFSRINSLFLAIQF